MENYLDMNKNIDYSKLRIPANIITKGGIVIFPTETVYGIGANALDKEAIRKLYEVKKRPFNKPISVLVNSIDMVNKIAKDISEKEYELMKKFFPGPLTIILKKKDIIPDILTGNTDTIGVRMPNNEIALKLIEYVGSPIATTSANISGEKSETSLENVLKRFEGKVDYFIDEGKSKIGIASTIVQVINEIPYILREGIIEKQDIL